MDYLENVLNEYRNNGILVSIRLFTGFVSELDKDVPDIIIWKNKLNLINISSGSEYHSEMKNALFNRLDTGEKNMPEILYVVDDKDTANKIYDALADMRDYEETLESIIKSLKSQPLILDLE